MDSRTYILRASIAILYIIVLAATFFTICGATNHGRTFEGHSIRSRRSSSVKSWKKLKSLNRLNKYSSFGYSNFDSYGSPSLPQPPFNSLAPQPSVGTPSLPAYSPVPNPHHNTFGPPSPNSINNNNSPPSPPYYDSSSQPKHAANPPPKSNVPNPNPSPPQVYLSPIVYPPPPSSNSPSSPHRQKQPKYAVWCVAKPTVPDPIIQLAMDYACGSGADCKSIQPNGSCYFPNTMLAHASYAFNSYWQNTKIGGGTCDFGGTAMLVTVDPTVVAMVHHLWRLSEIVIGGLAATVAMVQRQRQWSDKGNGLAAATVVW